MSASVALKETGLGDIKEYKIALPGAKANFALSVHAKLAVMLLEGTFSLMARPSPCIRFEGQRLTQLLPIYCAHLEALPTLSLIHI